MKKTAFLLLLFCSSIAFAQNESIQVSNDNSSTESNNPLGNQDVSQVQNNVEQQIIVPQNNYNPVQTNVPPNNINIRPQRGNVAPTQQVQAKQNPQKANPGNYNRSTSSSSRSYGGGSVSMGSGKAHKKGFFKTFGKKIEKARYKTKGKRKWRHKPKRNRKSILRCFQ